jgi:hypothetical protein
LAALRRYHLWLQRLPKEERDLVDATPPQERMALVTKLRAKDQASEARRRTPVFLQVVDLGDMSPFDVAQWLKIWFSFPPAEREKIERGPRARGLWLDRFQNSLDPGRNIDPPQGQFTASEEEALVRRMMDNHEFRHGLPGWISAVLVPPGRGPEATRNPEASKSETRSEPRERTPSAGRNAGPRTFFQYRRANLVHCLAGNYYFIENPPDKKVEPSNLFRFLAALPKWISESYTYLPPEEARRRLTILYRLLYPTGEMPLSGSAPLPPGAPPTESTGKEEPVSPRPAPAPPDVAPF